MLSAHKTLYLSLVLVSLNRVEQYNHYLGATVLAAALSLSAGWVILGLSTGRIMELNGGSRMSGGFGLSVDGVWVPSFFIDRRVRWVRFIRAEIVWRIFPP